MSNLNFTPWGTTVITTQEALADQSNIFYSVFGTYPNLYPASPTGAFIQELTNNEVNVNNTCVYICSNVYSLQATNGIFLDGIGGLFGIDRNPATATTVTCQLTGFANTVIPANSIVSNGQYQFKNSLPITLDSSGNGIGLFECTTLGQINVQANSVNLIITAITGWTTVNNNMDGNSGDNVQNDTSYRYVLQYAQARNGRGFVESLYSILTKFIAQDGSSTTNAYGINVPYIQGFYIYSNYTNNPQTIVSGKPAIPRGGVYITLYAPQYLATDNPNLEANKQYIAGLILSQIGANTTNNIQADPYKFSFTYQNPNYPAIDPVLVNFDTPIPTPIEISYTIKLYNPNVNKSDLITKCKNAILEQFYNGYSTNSIIYPPVRMNQPINTADFIANLVNNIGACTIIAQDIQLITGGTAGVSLSLTVDKIATLTTDNITIIFE